MPRLISCAETIPAILDRSKTVTRRLGWWEDRNGRRLVVPGDQLTICGQVMGRKPGQPITRYATVELVDVSRGPLHMITSDDVRREGVIEQVTEWSNDRWDLPGPLWTQFVWWYCETFRCTPHTNVTRIEWTWDGAIFHDGMTT